MRNLLILFIGFIAVNSFGQIKETETITIETTPNIEKPSKDENSIYNSFDVDVKPEFSGGLEKFYAFVNSNLKVSKEIKTHEIKGKILVTFVVEKNGKLDDIKVIRDIGYGSGKEAIRILKNSPKWKPAQHKGKKVSCHYTLPIIIDGTK